MLSTYLLTTAIGVLLGQLRANEAKPQRVDISFWVLEPKSDFGSATRTLKSCPWNRLVFIKDFLVYKSVNNFQKGLSIIYYKQCL